MPADLNFDPNKPSKFRWYHAIAILLACAIAISVGSYLGAR